MADLLTTCEEEMAPGDAIVRYPGAEKLANVVNAFWGTLSGNGGNDSTAAMDAQTTQELARALFAALFEREAVLAEVLRPVIVRRPSGEG